MFSVDRLFNASRWNAPARFRTDSEDVQLVDAPGTLVLPMQRSHLLRYLPNGARVAEIGVARGKFSTQLVQTCRPAFLALVDPWQQQKQDEYFSDNNNVSQRDQDQRCLKVARRFTSTKPGRECRVIRAYSVDAAREFEDGFFDWVFIDGNHSHAACLEDLRTWAPKVRADGLICGHDFAVHGAARSARFGVVSAVNTFIDETKFALAAITVEHFPTFVIAKDVCGSTLARFRRLLFSFERHLIQVRQGEAVRFDHARILDSRNSRSAFVAFMATQE